MPVCATCGELPRTAFSKAQLKKKSGAMMHCASCTADAADQLARRDCRSTSGQFTAEMHQRARDAEAAGRLQLSQAAAMHTQSEQQQADEPITDVPIHDRVADDLRSLNGLLAACAHEPLNSHSFWLFRNWLNAQGLQPTVASVCTWKGDRALDLPSLNAMLAADGRDPLDDQDFEAFQRWNGDGPMHEESVGDWENSPEGEQWCLQRIAEQCACSGRCTCTWRGIEPNPMIPGVTCDDFRGMDSIAELINYGSQPEQWQPSGGDHMPEGWVGDGTSDHNLDPTYLGMPDLTSFCTLCNRIRPGEVNLSRVEARSDGKAVRTYSCTCMPVTDALQQTHQRTVIQRVGDLLYVSFTQRIYCVYRKK